MLDIDNIEHNPISEKIVNILVNKTQNPQSASYFRILTGFYLCQMASSMRANVVTKERGVIPINMYALLLGTSGMGKGFSMNIMENEIFNQFRDLFMSHTFPYIVEEKLRERSVEKASMSGETEEDELLKLEKEFRAAGAMPYSFDSGTAPAFKQVRHKALLAGIGSLNFICDEIGTNLLSNAELLAVYLEAYDVGKIKQKLTKNTSENQRSEEINGAVPTNMLLMGTPTKLFNGAKEEQEMFSLFETGYGRRCHYAFGFKADRGKLSAKEIYAQLTDTSVDDDINSLSADFGQLANPLNYNKGLLLKEDETILLIEYRLRCEELADLLPEHEEIRKAEISHRYFKAMKLAGAYAFAEDSPVIREEHLLQAIKVTEESGKAFNDILTRDKNYVRLAKYVASTNRQVTHADLTEELPFYRGSASVKSEMFQLAAAWGYQHNIVLKKHYVSGIEFISGESLEETDINAVTLSFSRDYSEGYIRQKVPFDMMHNMMAAPNYHWCNHGFVDDYRKEENAKLGFNLIVLDIDNGVSIETAKDLLKDYQFMLYTTKRHTDEENRFRLILPTKYLLKLSALDYTEFMRNLAEWLPFGVDDKTFQRAKKWQSHDGHYEYNEGQLLDPLQFIPKTSKNEERKNLFKDLESLDNLQRWFVNNTGEGNRSNQLIRYALCLLNAGLSFANIQSSVLDLNNKLQDSLPETEIHSTIMTTVANRIGK